MYTCKRCDRLVAVPYIFKGEVYGSTCFLHVSGEKPNYMDTLEYKTLLEENKDKPAWNYVVEEFKNKQDAMYEYVNRIKVYSVRGSNWDYKFLRSIAKQIESKFHSLKEVDAISLEDFDSLISDKQSSLLSDIMYKLS